MCSSTSPRFLAASTISSSRSRTFTWPVNSLNAGGRSEISKAASGSGGFTVDGAVEYWSSGLMRRKYQYSSSPLLQLFCEHQFRAAAFVYVIDFVKGIANQIQT